MRRWPIGVAATCAMLGGAFYVASTPDIPRSVLEAKYATPPSQFVMLPDGARAHLRDRGPRDAPALILLHGSGASLFTWEPWAARLDSTLRVVTIDLPDHGLTGAVPDGDYTQRGMERFVMEIADRLGLRTFTIGGNSMGGGVAARVAEDYPARVTHLILVDASGLAVKRGQQPLAFRLLWFLSHIPGTMPLLLHVTPRILIADGLRDAIVHRSIITDRMIDQYWDFARMAGTRAATAARFRAPWNFYERDHLGHVVAPTLILWGAQDRLIPVATAQAFAKAIAHAKVIVYPGTGHLPQEEVPDRSAADVRAFLRS